MPRLSKAMLEAAIEAADKARDDLIQRTVLDPLEAEVRAYCAKFGRDFWACNGQYKFVLDENHRYGISALWELDEHAYTRTFKFRPGERVALRRLLELCDVEVDSHNAAGDMLTSVTIYPREDSHASQD